MKNTAGLSGLFDAIDLKGIQLKNRLVMAPMTRSRSNSQGEPADFAVEYYSQRAGAGLIITEGTSPSPNGYGYSRTPGIHSESQIEIWKKITEKVHEQNSKIFLQIMHVGRVAHWLNKSEGSKTVSASAIKAEGQIYTDQQGLQDMVIPKELSVKGIQSVIEEYRQSTENAFKSGFDGVELHAASGYLPMQFLSSNTNLRKDQYGGPIGNRIRFIIEVLEAMASIKGSNRVGIRIWPGSTFNDIKDLNPMETYTELLRALNKLNLLYVHSIRSPDKNIDVFKLVRQEFNGFGIVNGGFDLNKAQEAIQEKLADLVSFGTLYISNPDLDIRFKKNYPLTSPDINTFYTPGAKGYIDYSNYNEGK